MTDSQTLIIMSNIWIAASMSANRRSQQIFAWMIGGAMLAFAILGNGCRP